MAGLLDLLGLGQSMGAGGGGLLDGLRDRSNQLTGLGAGLLQGNNWQSGLASGFQGGALGKAIDVKAQEKKKQENATAAWLAQHPELDQPTRDYLSANPEAAGSYFSQVIKPKDPLKVGAGDTLVDPTTYKPLFQAPSARNPNDPMAQFEARKAQAEQLGILPGDPRYDAFVGTGRFPQTAPVEGAKLPAGFLWNDPNDPNKGVHAITGGPAEQIPAEVAGRLGMARNWIKDAGTEQMAKDPAQADAYKKTIRGRIEGGALDGLSGAAGLASGVGEAGQIGLTFESGKEALVRMLTGAGKSESEARDYANRYSPSPTDSRARILWKLDHLNAELEASANEIGRGRGGVSINGQGGGTQSTADPYGIR